MNPNQQQQFDAIRELRIKEAQARAAIEREAAMRDQALARNTEPVAPEEVTTGVAVEFVGTETPRQFDCVAPPVLLNGYLYVDACEFAVMTGVGEYIRRKRVTIPVSQIRCWSEYSLLEPAAPEATSNPPGPPEGVGPTRA